MSSRRDAVPFDSHYFEKQAAEGATSPADAIFRDIYRRNHWAGPHSPSGQGASPDQVRGLGTALPSLLRQLAVEVLLDLPCGDYSWMRLIELPVARYIGADLLPELVQPLEKAYTDARHRFLVLDLTRDPLPEADLLLCRDCLVHLSFADIGRALSNVLRSGIPYLLTTTFPECEVNEDIVTGDWRPLNLELEPFGFPPPSELLNERCSEAGGIFADKSLGLWQVAELTNCHSSAVTVSTVAVTLKEGHDESVCLGGAGSDSEPHAGHPGRAGGARRSERTRPGGVQECSGRSAATDLESALGPERG